MADEPLQSRAVRLFRKAPTLRLLTASAVIGVAVSLIVAVFYTLAVEFLLAFVLRSNIFVLAAAPAVSIMATHALLEIGGRGLSSSTTNVYVRAFHERHPRIPIGELPRKLLAGLATIGGGGAVGLEAPSIYTGSTLGLFVHRKLSRFFRQDEAHILLTAGAAAAVSAAFKTPATGVIFALEAPYRDDVAPQALVPSLISSAASYTTLVALLGSEPVVPFLWEGLSTPDGASFAREWMSAVHLDDLRGALILGVTAGLAGRGFTWMVRCIQRSSEKTPRLKRAAIASVILSGLAVASHEFLGEALSLGSGRDAMAWVFQQEALHLIAVLFAIRIAASLATVYGGGVGGLFIPLCTLGVIVGQFVGAGIVHDSTGLYPTLGLAAFLSAGFHTPIAAVMFVAESTRGLGAFVVPALIAAAVSQVVSGPLSVEEHQRGRRHGHLEGRLMLPISSIIDTVVFTVPPDATVSEFVYVHVLGRRERVVPVVDGSVYLGMAQMSDVGGMDRDDWEAVTVQSMMATHLPTARPSWTLRDAVVAMDNFDVEVIAVVDNDDNFIGVVTEDDVVRLEEILDETEE